jgi:outer membrane protein
MLYNKGFIRISYSRLCATLWALCFQLFCLAQGTSNAVATPETPLLTQLISIGYLSYDSALAAMPDYTIVKARQQELRKAYETELKRVEEEFNQKYEAFLEGQKDFPRTILLKRQTELQQLMEQNLEFKRQGREELRKAEEEAMKPLYKKLDKAIADVARKKGIALVVNTDSHACPFIDPEMGIDLQEAVATYLLTHKSH